MSNSYAQRITLLHPPHMMQSSFDIIQRHKVFRYTEYVPPESYACFCPHCGEIWMRAQVEGQAWAVLTRPCIEHGKAEVVHGNFILPGSLWLDWDKDFNNSLSEALLVRELELHLNLAEREMANAKDD